MLTFSAPATGPVPVTSLYAGLLALTYFLLSLRVIRLRLALKQPLGDGGSVVLARAIRMHAHFAEYVPLALLLMLLLELSGLPGVALHAYGLLLLTSRLLHAGGLTRLPEVLAWRLAAMVVTLHLLAGAALWLVLVWWQA